MVRESSYLTHVLASRWIRVLIILASLVLLLLFCGVPRVESVPVTAVENSAQCGLDGPDYSE
jgi:hypothetical protein